MFPIDSGMMNFQIINPYQRGNMEIEITTVYCLCADLLKALNHRDDHQSQMSTAEVMTTALVATRYFGGHMENSQTFLKEHGYIPNMLGPSRFNRRFHAIPNMVWFTLFSVLSQVFKRTNRSQEYSIDSFPVPVCDNIRISRSRLYHGEEFRGYCASKRRYFYGLRVHMIVSSTGQPIELIIAPGGPSDTKIMRDFNYDLPPGAYLYGDKAFNDYPFEDFLKQWLQINLIPLRKKNSHRPLDPYFKIWLKRVRQRCETTFSQITALFPKTIHAVTPKGFETKVMLFVIAFAIQCL